MTEVSDLPPFDPPYDLSGRCFVLAGAWEGDVPARPPAGFRVVRLLGRPAALVVACDYERPPAALPLRYREVIAATVARRGLELVALPFDMVLDERLPVELGHLHYGLPKRFDPGLVVRFDAEGLRARAGGLALEAPPRGRVSQVLGTPLRALATKVVHAATASLDVVGTSTDTPRRSRIVLSPEGPGTGYGAPTGSVGDAKLVGLWAQAWRWTLTWLGPPRPGA